MPWQELFNNFWNTFGANFELIGFVRQQVAGAYSFLLSSQIR